MSELINKVKLLKRGLSRSKEIIGYIGKHYEVSDLIFAINLGVLILSLAAIYSQQADKIKKLDQQCAEVNHE